MNRNQVLSAVLLAIAFITMSFVQEDAKQYKALTDKSSVVWVGRKVGGEHTGTVNLKSGSFTVKDGLITAGKFVIDMTSVTVTDSDSKKLLRHIRSEDFFNVEKYKESSLEITGSKRDDKGNLVVSGNMTILGKTNPITFTAKEVGHTDHYSIYTTTIEVDRTKWGITYKSSAVGDTFIKDVFDLKVKLTGELVENKAN